MVFEFNFSRLWFFPQTFETTLLQKGLFDQVMYCVWHEISCFFCQKEDFVKQTCLQKSGLEQINKLNSISKSTLKENIDKWRVVNVPPFTWHDVRKFPTCSVMYPLGSFTNYVDKIVPIIDHLLSYFCPM